MSTFSYFRPSRLPWRRLFFLGFLAAIGYAAYVFSAPLPRWQVQGRHYFQSPWDDAVLVTADAPPNSTEDKPSWRTFTWWDLHTGDRQKTLEEFCSYHVFSNDRSMLAAGMGKEFWLVDVAGGRKVVLPGAWDFLSWPSDLCYFSGDGSLLARVGRKYEDRLGHQYDLLIFDTRTGTLRKKWEKMGFPRGFVAASNCLVYGARTKDEEQYHLHLWDADVESGITFGPYENPPGPSPDGRHYLALASFAKPKTVDLIDLAERRVVLQIPWTDVVECDYDFSDDGRFLALRGRDKHNGSWTIGLWDLQQRKKLSSFVANSEQTAGVLAPNGTRCALFPGESLEMRDSQIQAFEVQMLDSAAGTVVWKHRFPNLPWGTCRFTADSAAFVVDVDDHTALAYFNAASGALEAKVRYFEQLDDITTTSYPEPTWSPHHRYVTFQRGGVQKTLRIPLVKWTIALGVKSELAVVDVENREQLASLSADEIHACRTIEEGPCLVTCHRQNGVDYLACWDLPPRRNWLWIIGLPMTTGIGLVAIKLGYRRWRIVRK
ncbi:MAG: WD40 repeat domain-containing protein [Gemmataceae bacterium]|nr:WD40 repeat domain-containing protein [Gemmataceae bacterium]